MAINLHTHATSVLGGDTDEHGCKASAGYSWDATGNKCVRPWEQTQTGTALGSDRDEHGCITSAGYSWNTSKGECTRPWEDQAEKKVTPRQNLQTGSWKPVSIDGKTVSGGELVFSKKGTYTAHLCNTLSGKYGIGGKRLNLRHGISTMMYCEEGNLMAVESALQSRDIRFTLV